MEKNNESTLVDIRQVPEVYRSIFAAYPSFNRMQSKVFNDVFNTDHSVVLSAPTGSGKTVVFELAIIRQLIAAEKSKYSNIFKIIYISPMKALCEERLIDWHKKFSPFGINCISVTGDSDLIDIHSLFNHNLIITTPEKWDSITRKWKENKRMIQVIRLFMIDEVHLLNEEIRGATLEALVCRMKTIESSLFDGVEENVLSSRQNIRFMAASATFPNIKDVSDWLGAKYYSFENSMRPVKLNTIVLGFSYNRLSTMFKFDISLNYKLPSLVMKYSNGKPTLIFCSTRKSVEMAVKHLIQNLTIPFSASHKELLSKAASSIAESNLKSGISHGIGFHHGGLAPETRSIIEQLFRNGKLPVLVTTSTLATGVNLPAHLVIIKATKFYAKGEFQDYPATSLLQMIGRAGRPQFDSEATALILTTAADKAKLEKMVDGKENIESNLHRHLTEHLNAEIVLRTITDLDVAMRWLSSTFLYIRARRNPRHYGIPLGLTTDKIDKKLLEICQIDLNKLVKAGMASMDEDVNISPTFLGTLMAKYYISFETMKLLKSMNGNELLQQILSVISKSKEFSDMRLRVDEKKCLNLLNKTKNENSIRFPFNGRIKTLDMKIDCTIQAIFGCLEIDDQSIITEAFRIMRLGERICRCLIEYLEIRGDCYTALLNATVLWKCFRTQLWENSKHVVKQFPGIGPVISKQLVNAGKTTLEKIIKTNPREIEMITNKKPPFGNKLVDFAKSIPRYDMKIETFSSPTSFSLKITLTLLNPDLLEESTFVNGNSVMCLLVGNNLNQILLHERYMHSYMLENNEVVRFVELNTSMKSLCEVYCNFVSEDIVGIDLSETYNVLEQKPVEKQKNVQPQALKTVKATKSTPKSTQSTKTLDPKYSSLVQTYIDKYMKCKKKTNSPTVIGQEDGKNCFASKNVIEPEKNEDIPQEIIPSPHQTKTEISEKMKKDHDKYSLSQFDITIIEKDPVNKDDKNTETEDVTPLLSFTDEEMLESVEFLLDQNEAKIPSYSDEQLKSKNVASALTTELASAELDAEFSRLYNKYKKTQNSETDNENKTQMKDEKSFTGQAKVEKIVRNPDHGISKKGKIHSVESFEKKLFNPKTDTLSLFRYQPTKRLVHSSRANDPPSAPQCKRKKIDNSDEKVTEDMMENLEKFINQNEKESLQYSKSIKWRSPLVYSPPVKFSPKISSSFSFSVPMPKNDSENSHDWSLNTVDTNNSSKTAVAQLSRTPEASKNDSQPRKYNQGTKFQLSDRGYSQADVEKPLNNTQLNMSVGQTPKKSRQIHDFFSSSFLEDVGFAERPKVNSNPRFSSQRSQDLNTSIRSAGSYYHDMVAKEVDSRKNSESSRQMSQKPFFLSQNHLTLPDNTLGNKTNYVSNNSQLMSQPIQQRRYIPYKEDQLEVLAPNVVPTPNFNMLDRDRLNHPWLEPQSHNLYAPNVQIPDYDLSSRNVLNTSVQSLGNRHMWPRSLPPEYTDQNRHFAFNFSQRTNYPVGLDNRELYNDPFEPRSTLEMTNNNNFRDNRLRHPEIKMPQPQTIPNTIPNQNSRIIQNRIDSYSSDLDNFIDKELLNYQMNLQNCSTNRNGNPLQTNSQGFFLNPKVYDGPNVAPLWNAPCEIHRIFNCFYCSNPNYNLQNIRGVNQNEFATRASEDFHRGPELTNGYFNNPPFVPFNQSFMERNRQDIPSIGDDRMQSSYLLQNYGQASQRVPQYGSKYQNTFGVQNMNIPGEMSYHNYQPEKNGSEEQTNHRDNKTFMISKFLNSFDDGSKNQE